MKLKKPLLSPEEKKYWETYINYPSWTVRYDIAEDPKTPLWVLEQLLNDDDCFVLIALCRNPSSSPEILDALINIAVNTKRSSIIHSLLRNPKLSERSYLKLSAVKKFKKSLLKPSI